MRSVESSGIENALCSGGGGREAPHPQPGGREETQPLFPLPHSCGQQRGLRSLLPKDSGSTAELLANLLPEVKPGW